MTDPKPTPDPRPTWRSRHQRTIRVLGFMVTAATFFGLGLASALWMLVCRGANCPSIDVLERYQPRQTSRIYAVDGRFIAELGAERRTLATIDDIPQVVQDAFVVTEDKRFYRHHGIDWMRIPGALARNIKAGAFEEGFSTITMQLARNVFPTRITRERRGLSALERKLKEMRVAVDIEQRYPKDRILELYLNQINLGAGAHGVETAARRYFGKSVRSLNLAEAATLAAIPKAPTTYNPRRSPDRAVQRRNTIIELMRRAHSISDADASLGKAYPLALARRVESGEIAPYFAEWVRTTLYERFGDRLYQQGLKVYTTLDLDMQAAAERAMEGQLRAIEGGQYGAFRHLTYEQHVARGGTSQAGSNESPYLQGAFVAIDPRDGSVRAMVGGRDFDDSEFNRATQAMRQPGSTFKPFVYSAAIHAGKSPASLIDDSPISLPQLDGTEWTPENFDLKFLGPMTIRRGLYDSRNIIAIRTGMELGEENVVDMARRFGITTPIPPYPSINIGSAEVHPVEQIGAYTTFANLGTRTVPNAILRVEDQEGNVLWKKEPESFQVLSTPEAWIMVNMLKDVVLKGTAYGRVWLAGFRVPSGGKTGTTNDGADVWYIGFTADLVAGVWIGFDKPKKIMVDAQGGRLAAPAYTNFMIEVYKRKPEPPDWPRPSTVIARSVDSLTGTLATLQCADRAYTEYFIPGTEPTRTCRDVNLQELLSSFSRPPDAARDTLGRADPFRKPD